MAILDMFSKRQKAAAKAGKPDIFQYADLPQAFRVQVAHILDDLIGTYQSSSYQPANPINERWILLHNSFAREKGKFRLTDDADPQAQCMNYLLKSEADDALDLIEVAFRMMQNLCADQPDWYLANMGVRVSPRAAVAELNQRFREHGLGYEFANGEIVRIDSQFIHAEAVRPVLALLAEKPFEKANEEFMTAHRHYREGHFKDSVVAANRSFETTLKTICAQRGWKFGPGDRAGELITVVRNNGLFPNYLDRGLDSYIAALKTGLPGVRNSAGGHGAEPSEPPVPEYIARYALHLAASNILLAVEASKA
jgi:hypothetical protein